MKEIQKDLNPKMRAILIDWLVLVHRKFKFNPETLFLAIEIIDRFLQKSPIPRQLLQLVGVSSILIASKIEEIYFPEIWDLVAMTDGAYSCKDIVEMEANIASALEFEFGFVCPIFFFDYYARKVQFDEKKRFFGHFVMELCMLEYSMLKYTKVVIAAGAFYLCNCVFGGEKKGNLWFQLPFEEIEIKDVAKEMLAIHLYQEKTKLKEIRVKYENEKFLKVANVKLEHIVM